MTEIFRCDVCGRIKEAQECKREGWTEVIFKAMSWNVEGRTVLHFCPKCEVLHANAIQKAREEYDKHKRE